MHTTADCIFILLCTPNQRPPLVASHCMLLLGFYCAHTNASEPRDHLLLLCSGAAKRGAECAALCIGPKRSSHLLLPFFGLAAERRAESICLGIFYITTTGLAAVPQSTSTCQPRGARRERLSWALVSNPCQPTVVVV